jgi:hypothetical protein
MRNGKARSCDTVLKSAITGGEMNEAVALFLGYMLALRGMTYGKSAVTITHTRQLEDRVPRLTTRRECNQMAQGNDFVWFFGVQ